MSLPTEGDGKNTVNPHLEKNGLSSSFFPVQFSTGPVEGGEGAQEHPFEQFSQNSFDSCPPANCSSKCWKVGVCINALQLQKIANNLNVQE